MAEAEQMAALGVHRLTVALRAKEIEAIRDEVGMLGELVDATRDL